MAVAVAVAPNPNQLHSRLTTIMGSIIMGRTLVAGLGLVAHLFTLRDTRLHLPIHMHMHMHMIHVMMQG